MSSEYLFPGSRALFQDTVEAAVSAALDGPNNPTLSGVDGRIIKSVVHTSTGLITFTLQDGFPRLRSAIPTLQKPTAVNLEAEISAVDMSARTVQVRLYKVVSAGSGSDSTVAAADPPAKASNALVLGLRLLFDNTEKS